MKKHYFYNMLTILMVALLCISFALAIIHGLSTTTELALTQVSIRLMMITGKRMVRH